MLKRITYTCRKCQWKDTIIEQWGDLKPKRCGNKACQQGFLRDPSWLVITLPTPDPVPVKAPAPAPETPKYKSKYKEDKNAQG